MDKELATHAQSVRAVRRRTSKAEFALTVRFLPDYRQTEARKTSPFALKSSLTLNAVSRRYGACCASLTAGLSLCNMAARRATTTARVLVERTIDRENRIVHV